jgi:hypothetical protein
MLRNWPIRVRVRRRHVKLEEATAYSDAALVVVAQVVLQIRLAWPSMCEHRARFARGLKVRRTSKRRAHLTFCSGSFVSFVQHALKLC